MRRGGTDLAAAVARGLRTARFGHPVHVYDQVTSTNDVARQFADRGAGEGTAVMAVEQTAGRGRLGRPWASPPGGLYLSVVLRPPLPTARWALLGIAVAVGAAAGAEVATGSPITLKWPNDLLSGGRKVGGILVEAGEGFAVAGIGINAAPTDEPPYPDAASLDIDVIRLAIEVLSGVEEAIDLIYADPAAVLARWRVRSATLGRRVRVLGAEVGTVGFDGIAEDIAPDGALVLRTAWGIRRVMAGDVVQILARPAQTRHQPKR